MTDDPFEQVLDYISEGQSLIEACQHPDMPSRKTVQRRCRTDAQFARAYQMAVEDRAEARAHRFNEILDRLERDEIDPSSARILLDGLKWQMGLDDRRFAERTRIEATGKDGAPLISEVKPISDFETARYVAYLLSKSAKVTVDAGELRAIGPAT